MQINVLKKFRQIPIENFNPFDDFNVFLSNEKHSYTAVSVSAPNLQTGITLKSVYQKLAFVSQLVGIVLILIGKFVTRFYSCHVKMRPLNYLFNVLNP